MKSDLSIDVWPYADALRELRTRAGNLSVERAAARVGTTRSTWHAWESGGKRPRHDNLRAIVEAFECPPSMVGYEPPRGWELVPADWITAEVHAAREDARRMHEETHELLRDILNAVRSRGGG